MPTKTRRRTSKAGAARLRKQLNASLRQLTESDLVRLLAAADAEYIFKHALVQDTAQSSLLHSDRKRLHRLVAETMLTAYPNALDEIATRVAQHYAQAGDAEQTAKYAELAGDAASALFAYPEARAQYADALNALETLPLNPLLARRRIDLLIKYVIAAQRLEGPDRSLENLAQAEALFDNIPVPETLEDRARRARIAFWQGDSLLHKSQPRQAVKYMQQVLEIVASGVDDESLAAIPANVMGRALAVQGQFPRAQPLLERAVPALEHTSNWREWVLAKGFLALTLAVRGDITAALTQTSGALARAQELGTLTGVADSYVLTSFVYMQAGQYAKSLAAAQASFEHARQLDDHLVMYIALNACAWPAVRLGQFETARQSFRQARQIAEQSGGQLVFADWFAVAEAELEFSSNTPAAALERAEAALEFAQTVGSLYSTAVAHRVCGQALAAQGKFDAAVEHWTEALQLFETGDARLEAARTHVLLGNLLRKHKDAHLASEHFSKAAIEFERSGLTAELEQLPVHLHAFPL